MFNEYVSICCAQLIIWTQNRGYLNFESTSRIFATLIWYCTLQTNVVLICQGFCIEAIWGKTTEEAENVAQTLDIPFSTSRIDDVLLRKDVDLILVLCPPSHHSQIAVKALGKK